MCIRNFERNLKGMLYSYVWFWNWKRNLDQTITGINGVLKTQFTVLSLNHYMLHIMIKPLHILSQYYSSIDFYMFSLSSNAYKCLIKNTFTLLNHYNFFLFLFLQLTWFPLSICAVIHMFGRKLHRFVRVVRYNML